MVMAMDRKILGTQAGEELRTAQNMTPAGERLTQRKTTGRADFAQKTEADVMLSLILQLVQADAEKDRMRECRRETAILLLEEIR